MRIAVVLVLSVSMSPPTTATPLRPEPVQAATLYRCIEDGGITYSDQPCRQGPSKQLEVKSVLTSESHQRIADESRFVEQLQRSRLRNTTTEERSRQREHAQWLAREKHCAALALKFRHAREDANRASGRHKSAPERTARKAEERYLLECGHG